MCGRFALKAPASTIADVFSVVVDLEFRGRRATEADSRRRFPVLESRPTEPGGPGYDGEFEARYNIAPTTPILAVSQAPITGDRRLSEFRWGLIPRWAKDKGQSAKMINARAETVSAKPAFKGAFRHRRLLVVADGYYEWRHEGKKKIPHLIGMRGEQPFAMAGIWEPWTDPDTGEVVCSCSIITTVANSLTADIHHRMPVILPDNRWDQWLDCTHQDLAAIQDLLVPYPPHEMCERIVSDFVNNVRHQGANCQAPPEAIK